MCGEREADLQSAVGLVGSSPRVRGTGTTATAGDQLNGFIPACAGNGIASRLRTPRPRVHPACAGNGTCRSRWRTPRSVHPRVCGERTAPMSRPRSSRGSSPRVRGTVRDQDDQLVPGRFIPACAGNGSSPRSARTSATVHPRVCGERGSLDHPLVEGVGSSPRVRGTVVRRQHERSRHRFIPACAGNGKPERNSAAT